MIAFIYTFYRFLILKIDLHAAIFGLPYWFLEKLMLLKREPSGRQLI